MNETPNTVPKLDERFICNLQGKDFVLYSGLLDLAHQHGLKSLEVTLVQSPTKDNGMTAICMAIASTQDGCVFQDVGDADPSNVNKKIAVHILRMASTRAKARVLRDLTNIGMTCLEELSDPGDEPVKPKSNGNPAPSNGNGAKAKTDVAPASTGADRFDRAITSLIPAINNKLDRAKHQQRFSDIDAEHFDTYRLEMLQLLGHPQAGDVPDSVVTSINKAPHKVIEAFVQMIVTGEVPRKN